MKILATTLNISCVLVLSSIAFSMPSEARTIHTTISMETFKGRCAGQGGEILPRNGGFICILDNGTSVQCFPDGIGGLDCDVIGKQIGLSPRVRKIIKPFTFGTRSQGNQTGNGNSHSGGLVKGGQGCSGDVC